jgi:hypothetical protein
MDALTNEAQDLGASTTDHDDSGPAPAPSPHPPLQG